MKTLIAAAAALLLSLGAVSAQTSNSTSGAGANAETNIGIVTQGGRIPKGVPSAIAPGLTASAVETCMGSSSAGGSGAGWGFSIGTTWSDNGCEARLDARTLWSFGEKGAALNRLCDQAKIRTAMFQAGRPCPGDEGRYIAARQQVQPGAPRRVYANAQSAPYPASGDVRTINGTKQVYRTRN